MNKHLITHAEVYCTETKRLQKTNLLLTEGQRCAERVNQDNLPDATVHAANGCMVLPALVDLCTHLREPGYKHKGTIESETLAALSGGVTTLCCSPTTKPVNDHDAITRQILDQSAAAGAVRVLPVGALTQGNEGAQLSEIASLQKAGCIAVSHSRGTPIDTQTLYRCFQYAASHGLCIFFEPEDSSFAHGCLHEGPLACRLGLIGQPRLAETSALARALLVAEETGTRLHISQVSCARSVELIEEAKKRGLNVSADVAIHSLVLTEQDIQDFDTAFHTRPPLRSESDRQALLQGVEAGVIDAIVSQHQPHDATSKAAPFAESASGISALETWLSLGVGLVNKGELTLAAWINATSVQPARIAGIAPPKGLAHPADWVVFDPNETWSLTPDTLLSKGKNTPFMGQSLKGRVRSVFMDGRPAYTREAKAQ